LTMGPSSADHVDVDVRFPSHRHIRSDAVILVLDRDLEPYHVLSWNDEEIAVGQSSAASPH
jgi:hypothetical protein